MFIYNKYIHIGFEKPSAIQQRAIMPMKEGRDVIAQSQSGTGFYNMHIHTYLSLLCILMRMYLYIYIYTDILI